MTSMNHKVILISMLCAASNKFTCPRCKIQTMQICNHCGHLDVRQCRIMHSSRCTLLSYSQVKPCTGRAGNGLGYYNVAGAYPSFAGSCTRYGKRVCSGLVEGGSTFPNGHPPHLRSALFHDSGPAALRKAGYNRDQYPRTGTNQADAPYGTRPVQEEGRHINSVGKKG